MGRATANAIAADRPNWTAFLELLKPITWFPPMWAFGCGVVSSGESLVDRWPFALAGVLLAGPLVCGTSQVVNDWFDRRVDAINEPQRPIPSGRAPGKTAFYFALAWTALSVLVAASLGVWILAAAVVGLALAWAYSAPPFRLKQNGWLGNAAVGLCYEGLPWFTAAAVMLGGLPGTPIILLALLYSIGAHGIMTLNDFKAIEGDKVMGVRTLPVQLGVDRAARLTCVVMALPQLIVTIYLLQLGDRLAAGIVGGLLITQLILMVRFVRNPIKRAVWFSGFGVMLFVLGMLASAFAVRGLGLAV
ncbi:MAG: chlorophyll synthase ChlG [Pseudomonadota bacterium]